MIKRLTAMLLCMVFLLFGSAPVQAAEGNMDGGGGGMGSGTGESFWTVGYDGVRVTVIEKKTKKAVGESFDWTNISPPQKVISFVRRNKLQYLAGAALAPNSKDYDKKIPEAQIPQVISSNGTSNISSVKSYFTDKKTITDIAAHAKMTYENLISGKFTILLEPIAYFKYDGIDYAMTATEAALYDRLVDGDLRKVMGNLTHQNLPLSKFLETAELGIPAWTGGGGIISNDNIIKYLGVGTVNFGAEDVTPPPIVETYDYEYRADTDVITAITISTGTEINPDNPGRARFGLPTGNITKEYVILKGESQLVWVKWHTPDEDMIIDVPVNVSGGHADDASLRIKITKLEENTPPNPEGRDRNDDFSLRPYPANVTESSKSWGEWWAQWHPDWIWHSESHDDDCDDDCDKEHGEWIDEGWWDFFWRSYSASLSVKAQIFPDEKVPTAKNWMDTWEMKSGYGVNAAVEVHMNTNGGSDNTAEVQHVIAVFSEFDFDTYDRLLVPNSYGKGYNATWQFKENEYSQFTNPVHFTPIWYPNGKKYAVSFTVLDAWTPAGMMRYVLTADNITIQGSAYDDWHIAPGYGSDAP